MKIMAWNINGYRAAVKKNIKDTIYEIDPDILCFQEIKAKEDQVSIEDITINGYQHTWNPAERPGYSGVATYIKNSVIRQNVTKGLGIQEFDVEGRVIKTTLEKFDLYNIYFPNGQRGMERVEYKIKFYKELLGICLNEQKLDKEIIITGDFNTAHEEIDLANPKENSKISGFLPIERDWVNKYLQNNFIDIFRLRYPEKVQYTWWTYRFNARTRNIGWRIDYFMITKSLEKYVNDVQILADVQGSDHCPVILDIF
jgi:exodeoxyribonuclease-3